MHLVLNPYLQARYFQEVLHDPQAAMDYINHELGLRIGKVPFFQFDAPSMAKSKGKGFKESSFERLIAHHMFRHVAYGSSDFLNVPYGQVFTALWEMFPQWEWILDLDDEAKATVAQYARIPVNLHGRSSEFLQAVLRMVRRETAVDDFCGRWLPEG